jgi:hypothetical protein
MPELLGYPLNWPIGWPRTKTPIPSRFKDDLTTAAAKNELVAEIERMGGRQIVITTNIPLKKAGSPMPNRRSPDDKGVAVYFTLNGQPKVFACDRWTRISDNMRAIAKTIEAIRGIERWGSSEILDRIYQGFQALPESGTYSDDAWWNVLEVDPDAGPDEVKEAYRKLIRTNHVDVGGDPVLFAKINEAYESATKHFALNGRV